MKARLEIGRREDLRTAHVSYSIWKAIRGESAQVEINDFVMGQGGAPEVEAQPWEVQKDIMMAHLAPFYEKRKKDGG